MTQTKHANVWAALAAVRRNFKTVELDGYNPHFKNKFATLKSLFTATDAALADAGLYVNMYPVPDGVAMEIHHLESDTIAGPYTELIVGNPSTPQARGSAVTYARRYLYQTVLRLVAEMEDDGNAASESVDTDTAQATKTPQNGQPATRDSDTVRKQFHATVTAIFNGLDVDDARHWLIDKWSRKNTPDNIRASTTNLTADEMQSIINDIKPAKAAAALRKVYMEEHPFEEEKENG